jgi:hypothetical protein
MPHDALPVAHRRWAIVLQIFGPLHVTPACGNSGKCHSFPGSFLALFADSVRV